MVTMVDMMHKKVLNLVALVFSVIIDLQEMKTIMIGVVVILSVIAMKMAWEKLKCPYLHLLARKMLILILSGKRRWISFLIYMITLLKRRQSWLQLSSKVMPSLGGIKFVLNTIVWGMIVSLGKR